MIWQQAISKFGAPKTNFQIESIRRWQANEDPNHDLRNRPNGGRNVREERKELR